MSLERHDVCVDESLACIIPAITWNMQYPTKWEPRVWRYATASTTLVPIIFASFNWLFAARLFTKESIREKWPTLCYVALGFFMLIYVVLRLFILGDMFWLLF